MLGAFLTDLTHGVLVARRPGFFYQSKLVRRGGTPVELARRDQHQFHADRVGEADVSLAQMFGPGLLVGRGLSGVKRRLGQRRGVPSGPDHQRRLFWFLRPLGGLSGVWLWRGLDLGQPVLDLGQLHPPQAVYDLAIPLGGVRLKVPADRPLLG